MEYGEYGESPSRSTACLEGSSRGEQNVPPVSQGREDNYGCYAWGRGKRN